MTKKNLNENNNSRNRKKNRVVRLKRIFSHQNKLTFLSS